MKSLLVSLACLLCISVFAQDAVNVVPGKQYYVGKNISYFMDSTRQLTAEQVAKMTFIPCQTDIMNLGNTPHNVWMKFSIQSATELQAYVELVQPLMNEIEVYEQQEAGIKLLFAGSMNKPHAERPMQSENWLLSLNIKPQATTFYVKGQSHYPFQIPVTVSAKDDYVEAQRSHLLFWGLYMGVVIFAFFYNLFIWFSVRERTYLYYIIYVLTSGLFYLGLLGFGFEFIWAEMPYINAIMPGILSITNISITLFTFRFLHITKQQKVLYYWGWTNNVIYVFIFIILLAGQYEAGSGLAQVCSLFVALHLITSGVVSLRKKVPTARFFLIAWTIFLAAVFVQIFTINNVIESNFFTTRCLFIGHMTELLLLSLALADRINFLKHDNEAKQKEIIHQLKENDIIQQKANEELEAKVEERTREVVNGAFKLKQAQEQLIEKEKMAAFGAVATRMAHEIQNPLNFVNNYSKISDELVSELLAEKDEKQRNETAATLRDNLKKVLEHGGRAAEIIHQLQEHGRTGTSHEFFKEGK